MIETFNQLSENKPVSTCVLFERRQELSDSTSQGGYSWSCHEGLFQREPYNSYGKKSYFPITSFQQFKNTRPEMCPHTAKTMYSFSRKNLLSRGAAASLTQILLLYNIYLNDFTIFNNFSMYTIRYLHLERTIFFSFVLLWSQIQKQIQVWLSNSDQLLFMNLNLDFLRYFPWVRDMLVFDSLRTSVIT